MYLYIWSGTYVYMYTCIHTYCVDAYTYCMHLSLIRQCFTDSSMFHWFVNVRGNTCMRSCIHVCSHICTHTCTHRTSRSTWGACDVDISLWKGLCQIVRMLPESQPWYFCVYVCAFQCVRKKLSIVSLLQLFSLSGVFHICICLHSCIYINNMHSCKHSNAPIYTYIHIHIHTF